MVTLSHVAKTFSTDIVFQCPHRKTYQKKMTWQCDGASLLSQFCSSSDMTQLWAEPPPDPVQARETLAEHREFTRPKWAI
jgi:hypothetical protein